MPRVKHLHVKDADRLGLTNYTFPSFPSSYSVLNIRRMCQGDDTLLVWSGKFIYNVTSRPELYYNHAK